MSWAGTPQSIYISTGYLNLDTLTHFSWNFFVFVCVFVIVIVIAGGLWIACVISFHKIYGLIGWQWSCADLLGCRVDLDFWRGFRVDGWTVIEGSLRGPRGPKNLSSSTISLQQLPNKK